MNQVAKYKETYGVDSIKFNFWLNKNHSISIGDLNDPEQKNKYVTAYKLVLKKRNTPFVSNKKYCSRCGEKMLKTEFYPSKINKCGYSSSCKACTKKNTYAIDPVKAKASHKRSNDKFKKEFGVDRAKFTVFISYWYGQKLSKLDTEERHLYAAEYKKHLIETGKA